MRLIAFGLAALLWGVASPAYGQAPVLRLCADPGNLPFAARGVDPPGFEVEIGRAVARELGIGFEVFWFPTTREALALSQLYEGRCDLFLGLPALESFTAERPRLALTVPYDRVRQALVTEAGGPASLDAIGGRAVAVQAMSLGDLLAFRRGLDRRIFLKPAETVQAVGKSGIAAAIADAALARWHAREHPRLRVAVLSVPESEVPIAAGIRAGEDALRARVNAALERLRESVIPVIMARYGPPASPASEAPAGARPGRQLGDLAGRAARAGAGLYATQCSACHGLNGKGSPVAADLVAYRGSADAFRRAVLLGRPGTAMLPWRGLLTDAEIADIDAYLRELGRQPGP